MLKIQTQISDQSKNEILELIKSQSTQAFFIGSLESDFDIHSVLSPLEYESLKEHIIFSIDVRSAFYDELGNLCFEILLPYETSYAEPIEAIAIGSATNKSLYCIALTPKIQKLEGVGGNFVFKTDLKGESAEMVFKTDHYISEAELQNFNAFLEFVRSDLKKETIDKINIALKPIEKFNQSLQEIERKTTLQALNDYLDNALMLARKEREKRDKIGKKDYFYRSYLPSTHIKLNQILKAADYPLLWFYSIQARGNDGGVYFRLPQDGLYSKGTRNTDEVGKLSLEGLPNIIGTFIAQHQGISGAFYTYGGSGVGFFNGGGGVTAGFDASRINPIYGQAEGVEVSHIAYLEGVFADTPLSQATIEAIEPTIGAFRTEIQKEITQGAN
ncbi:hypothetical protein BKH46_07455 [Helicobacter sp. 12S02634-8]|uniref:hypothetical protein n=1 Tax=Helicobacter sp. 12S02634-8 TaxID=1476199 RepID=UPI000BA6F829|nr:hypothetical protein [Helicobacter sp. 12S02634-8]PAF46417.1 hypothetical protein BKH46_07455 [Helicobacter sp. 12S02634-8]